MWRQNLGTKLKGQHVGHQMSVCAHACVVLSCAQNKAAVPVSKSQSRPLFCCNLLFLKKVQR